MKKRGFTLIELLIVIAILGVLIAIAVAKFGTLATERNIRACQANLKILTSALNIYYVERGEKTGINDLVDEGYLVAKPVCPLGGTYVISNDSLYASCPVESHSLPHG